MLADVAQAGFSEDGGSVRVTDPVLVQALTRLNPPVTTITIGDDSGLLRDASNRAGWPAVSTSTLPCTSARPGFSFAGDVRDVLRIAQWRRAMSDVRSPCPTGASKLRAWASAWQRSRRRTAAFSRVWPRGCTFGAQQRQRCASCSRISSQSISMTRPSLPHHRTRGATTAATGRCFSGVAPRCQCRPTRVAALRRPSSSARKQGGRRGPRHPRNSHTVSPRSSCPTAADPTFGSPSRSSDSQPPCTR